MAIGKKTGGGSRKGKPNKTSLDIAEKLASMGCDPIEGMARIALDCETAFTNRLEELVQGEDVNIPGLYKDLSLAGQMYKELAQYVAPKRKAVEMSVTGKNGVPLLSNLSDDDLMREMKAIRERIAHIVK